MKLGIYVPVFQPEPAGLGVYIEQMCTRVAVRLDGTVLFTCTPEHVPSALRERCRLVPVLPQLRRAPRARVPARHVWLQTVLPAVSRRSKLDVLLSPLQEASIAPGVPQVVVIHDLTPLRYPSPYFNPLFPLYLREVLPRALRASEVVAVSRNTARDLTELLGIDPGRIRVIGEGYDRTRYYPRSPSDVDLVREKYGIARPYLLYSGTFARHKNTRLLPRLLAACRSQGLDIQLVLCGRPDTGEFPELRADAARLGVADQVIVAGYVPIDDLATLMTGATAFVYPSLYEGFGLAALEAMACGAVVLASDRASLPEVVGDGGHLLDPDHIDGWIDAIRSASIPAVAAERRAAAIRRASTFDWDRAATEMLAVLSAAAR